MEHSSMKGFVEMMLRHSAEQNSYLLVIQEKTNADEFNEIRSIVAKSLGNIYLDVLYPIFEKYPELKPEHLS